MAAAIAAWVDSGRRQIGSPAAKMAAKKNRPRFDDSCERSNRGLSFV